MTESEWLTSTWLAWNDGVVRRLAERIYSEGLWADAGIWAALADALEEAGCSCEEILRHARGQKRCVQCGEDGCSYCLDGWVEDWWLRNPSPTPPLRVRGDWLIDLLTGRS